MDVVRLAALAADFFARAREPLVENGVLTGKNSLTAAAVACGTVVPSWPAKATPNQECLYDARTWPARFRQALLGNADNRQSAWLLAHQRCDFEPMQVAEPPVKEGNQLAWHGRWNVQNERIAFAVDQFVVVGFQAGDLYAITAQDR